MFIEELSEIVGSEFLISSEEGKGSYVMDKSIPMSEPAEVEAVVKPADALQIAAIMQVCDKYNKAVTPRGGGSGVTGGAVPVRGGVVLSLERLNKILDIDLSNGFAVLESGVRTVDFCAGIESAGMFFPIVPGSKSMSFIGGNIAENAGSPRSCKYGTMKDYVLNLEVVLPTGEIIWTGANVYKNSTGLNLTQLFAGSEGVLGIITKAVLKILPKPLFQYSILAGFSCLEKACCFVLQLAKLSKRPCCVELITEEAIRLTAQYLTPKFPLTDVAISTQVLIEFDGNSEWEFEEYSNEVGRLLEKHNARMIVGKTVQQSEALWVLRNSIHFAMTVGGNYYRDIDSCVPPAKLCEFTKRIMELGNRYGRRIACFGHALDGNLHTMLLFSAQEAGDNRIAGVRQLLMEIFNVAISLGGTISGEHGIGCLQQEFLPLQFSQTHIRLMRQIKTVFDPKGILNPGKMLLDVTIGKTNIDDEIHK